MRVLIVGAGLAGLTCAKVLSEKNVEVSVFEASDGVGGRVRTDTKDGFLLDRGFQVYFTAYPAARRHLDHEKLDLRRFDPGAVIHRGRRRDVLSDPVRDPGSAMAGLLSDAATFGDKTKTLSRSVAAGEESAESVGEVAEERTSTYEHLRATGFSDEIIANFFRPFYGGIFLDRSLATSSRVFRFTFSMMAKGETTVPAKGIGEIPKQLAARLPNDSIHLGTPVEELVKNGERVVGVKASGEEYEADAVIVATEAPAAARLAGSEVPEGSVGEVCVYYEMGGAGDGRKISLGADDGSFFNNAQEMSAVSDEYAPSGRRLASAVALDAFEISDEEIYRRGIAELSDWYPHADFRPLAVYRIPYCQFAQPPGVHETLPKNRTDTPGLFLAGEFTEDSSIDGSMLSGEKAAMEAMRR
ncbi:MAG: FAD-dependent oxidoreductase [Actinomycetota bacterium]|jgi:phytoene dehydrogenase-like protein|nr:FAD-dependent oxidoreductase [Actinomycetota bacterium]